MMGGRRNRNRCSLGGPVAARGQCLRTERNFPGWLQAASRPRAGFRRECSNSASDVSRNEFVGAPRHFTRIDRRRRAMRPLLNSAGINIRRAVGPALTGLVIAWWGMLSHFWIDSAASLGMIAALFWLVRTSYQPTSPVDDY